jgi:hypothetical protein
MIYSPALRRAHMDKELDEHLEKVYGSDALEAYEEKLPEFLYITGEGEVALGMHGDTVVTEEWNKWLEEHGVEL